MSIAAAYLELLRHPLTGEALSNHEDGKLYSRNDVFGIREQVPVLLTKLLQPTLSETAHHQKAGTSFQYKEHYQKDAAYFDYAEEIKDPVEKEEINRLHQYIVASIPKDAEWILDVGCGNAWLAKEMTPKGKKVISMDISDINPIKALKAVPSENHFGLVADVYELPLKENSIDCIVAAEIIEHVPDPKLFIEKLLAALKPGGKLIITTPFNEHIRYSQCIHCNQLTPHNAHLHSFTEASIKNLVPTIKKIKTRVCNNKGLVKLRLHLLFSFLPFDAWKELDELANAIARKAYRLMVMVEK